MDLWYRGDDKFIGQRIALEKYEEYETRLVMKQVKPGTVTIDVGANIGYYTLLMARTAKKVYAIEPEEENFEILKKNAKDNNLKNVVLVKAGASNKNERKYLIKDNDNYGNHRLNEKNGIVVNCLRLDKILKNEQNISLMKIDVEGWEAKVIEGAKKIIRRDSPTLFLEYHPGKRSERMMKFLRKIYRKNIWQIDYWFYVSKRIGKKIEVDPKTGYVDLWMKKKAGVADFLNRYRYIQIRKVIKRVLGVS